jgi:hypothetical protein
MRTLSKYGLGSATLMGFVACCIAKRASSARSPGWTGRTSFVTVCQYLPSRAGPENPREKPPAMSAITAM